LTAEPFPLVHFRKWQAAQVGWGAARAPFHAAYARLRHAESLLATGASRSQAEVALRPAHQVVTTLGAAPLRREVELLAARGRLRLTEPAGAATVPTPLLFPTDRLG
jgi:hypothetical protein